MIDSFNPRRLLPLLLLALLLPTGLSAQNPRLRGVVTDPEGLPVAGITVSLHRVSEQGGGEEVGRDVTGEDGRFEIVIGADHREGGVYFAATRFEGTLYMGEPFRSLADLPDGFDYPIIIGSGGITAGPAVQQPPAPPPSDGRGLVLIIAAAALLAISLPFLRSRRKDNAREVLAEIARLDEEFAARPGGPSPESDPEYIAAREALQDRLKGLVGSGRNAADND